MLTICTTSRAGSSLAADTFVSSRFLKGREMFGSRCAKFPEPPARRNADRVVAACPIRPNDRLRSVNAECAGKAWGSPERLLRSSAWERFAPRIESTSFRCRSYLVTAMRAVDARSLATTNVSPDSVTRSWRLSPPRSGRFRSSGVDLALRPEAAPGPWSVRSEHGKLLRRLWRMWERLALIKARWTVGTSSLLRFLRQLQPFIFPKQFPTPDLLDEVAAIKIRSKRHSRLLASGAERNVGPGASAISIFVVQALQLLHARVIRFCRSSTRAIRGC